MGEAGTDEGRETKERGAGNGCQICHRFLKSGEGQEIKEGRMKRSVTFPPMRVCTCRGLHAHVALHGCFISFYLRRVCVCIGSCGVFVCPGGSGLLCGRPPTRLACALFPIASVAKCPPWPGFQHAIGEGIDFLPFLLSADSRAGPG